MSEPTTALSVFPQQEMSFISVICVCITATVYISFLHPESVKVLKTCSSLWDPLTGRITFPVMNQLIFPANVREASCQSVSKKSIIEKIKKVTGRKVFPESGPSLSVQISVRNDETVVMLNVSGEALSRRGYRTWNGEAPLRETLASALVSLSGWKPGQPLHDPCCGTGTILTEAALLAENRDPGINRHFAMEDYHCFSGIDYDRIREKELSGIVPDRIKDISGSDINPEALELAHRHIRQAGLDENMISLSQISLQDLSVEKENGYFICNPPYGERLSDQKQCRALYHDLFLLKKRHPTWKLCAISSDPAFERSFGRRADRKRRLYNGRLECVYYIYY